MKIHSATLFAVALAAAAATTPALAADKEGDAKLSSCVTLADGFSTTRFGTQYLLVENGDDHYRISFSGNQCGVLATTIAPTIKTGDEANTLCPKGTTVHGRNGISGRQANCRVREVAMISAERFTDYKRANR